MSLENIVRRIRKSGIKLASAAGLIFILYSGCGDTAGNAYNNQDQPLPDPPPVEQPATETEGASAIEDAINDALTDLGVGNNYREVYSNANITVTIDDIQYQGTFDLCADIDTDGDSYTDFTACFNYLTGSDLPQNLPEADRVKSYEMQSSTTTTRTYIYGIIKSKIISWLSNQ